MPDDIFGGLFDFDGDGKTDAFELGLGFAIMDEMDRESRKRATLSSSSLDDDDDDDDLLDMTGFSRFDLELMDEEERATVLEDAGLDPSDFDF